MSINKILSISLCCFALIVLNSIAFGQKTNGAVLNRSIESQALDSSLKYNIYLPANYYETDKKYPVLYLLHGYTGDHKDWTEQGDVHKTMDTMISQGATRPFIVVMPDAHNSWYVDSDPEISWGNYETAIISDLRKHIEDKYRVLSQPNSRYIAGLSMGGYGALHLAFKYPRRFKAAASLSGAFWPQLPKNTDILENTFGRPPKQKTYRQENPFQLATTDSTKQMPVYITCGDDDTGLFHHSVAMYDTLRKKGYDAELRITDGAHSWEVWSREIEDVIEFFNNN
ncbi:MAG: esterase family protein [Bacteroidales bacterium]|nr:esterase family protein [Bacteroidales bacterium]MCF8338525.1 esterase family protein [Bacteroidales bacterium]